MCWLAQSANMAEFDKVAFVSGVLFSGDEKQHMDL